MRLLLGILSVLLIQSQAFADSNHTQFVSYLQKTYGMKISKVTAKEILNLDSDLFAIDESLHEQLLSVAQSQAEIWADTVLEGDVAAIGEIELVAVEALEAKKEVVGYRITYTQRAWDTSNCDLSNASEDDYKNPATFAQCAEGKIIESTYVTAELANYFADIDNLAQLELN